MDNEKHQKMFGNAEKILNAQFERIKSVRYDEIYVNMISLIDIVIKYNIDNEDEKILHAMIAELHAKIVNREEALAYYEQRMRMQDYLVMQYQLKINSLSRSESWWKKFKTIFFRTF